LIVSFRKRRELVETSQMPLLRELKNSWRGLIVGSGQRNDNQQPDSGIIKAKPSISLKVGDTVGDSYKTK